MLIAANTTQNNGRKLLIFGLEEENIIRLIEGQPIKKDLGEQGVPGLEEWEIVILGPDDTDRFVETFGLKGKTNGN